MNTKATNVNAYAAATTLAREIPWAVKVDFAKRAGVWDELRAKALADLHRELDEFSEPCPRCKGDFDVAHCSTCDSTGRVATHGISSSDINHATMRRIEGFITNALTKEVRRP